MFFRKKRPLGQALYLISDLQDIVMQCHTENLHPSDSEIRLMHQITDALLCLSLSARDTAIKLHERIGQTVSDDELQLPL